MMHGHVAKTAREIVLKGRPLRDNEVCKAVLHEFQAVQEDNLNVTLAKLNAP